MIDPQGINVVAFDCDGVMFDSSQANRAYYNHILAHFGMPSMTAGQFAYAHMHTVDQTLEYLIPDTDMLSAARQYRRKMRYLSFIRYMVVEPTLKVLLEKLTPAFKTAIATNRTDTMDRVLSEHHLEGQFDIVVTASDVRYPKPHPEQLNVIVKHFDIDPQQMIYIGDSLLDAQAAKAAAVPFIAYCNPDLSADAHIVSLQQIESILGL
ncbi:MAG: HAD-IA family hydrolase [Desulfobacteraceae bacterium]